jgi:hypothetical protein
MPDNFALNIVLADVGPIQMELMQPLGKNPPTTPAHSSTENSAGAAITT